MKIKETLAVALVAVCAGCSPAPVPDTKAADAKAATELKAKDEADIKAMEDRFVASVKARDVNAIMANYTPDAAMTVFDVMPPLKYTGADGYRKDWQGLLDAFPGAWDLALSELEVTVGGDVAYGHSIQRITFADKAGKKTAMTVRVTDGYKKTNGQWLIAHEHASVPVDLEKMKPVLDAK